MVLASRPMMARMWHRFEEFWYAAIPDNILVDASMVLLVSRWMDGKKHIVGLVELYAVVLAIYHWDIFLKGRRVIFFVDNIPSMRSLIKGTSSEREWRELLRSLESIEIRGPTYSWFARAPSDSNIADGPSRDDDSGLELFEATIPVCIFAQSLVQW